MNERIEHITKQVDEYFDDLSIEFSRQAWMEKFAELIVKECIAKVELRKKFAIEDGHTIDHAFDLLVYDIEQHFGVEE